MKREKASTKILPRSGPVQICGRILSKKFATSAGRVAAHHVGLIRRTLRTAKIILRDEAQSRPKKEPGKGCNDIPIRLRDFDKHKHDKPKK